MHKIPSDTFSFGMVSLSYIIAKKLSNIGRFSLACSHETKICPVGLIARKNLKISVTFSVHKKRKRSIFLKIFFENEFFEDMEIYQKKTNWKVRGTLSMVSNAFSKCKQTLYINIVMSNDSGLIRPSAVPNTSDHNMTNLWLWNCVCNPFKTLENQYLLFY